MTNCRNHLYFYERLFLGKERKNLLENHGWYKNLAGNYVHPHCMDFLSFTEIRRLTPAQLDYKLMHGSQSPLPEELKRTLNPEKALFITPEEYHKKYRDQVTEGDENDDDAE